MVQIFERGNPRHPRAVVVALCALVAAIALPAAVGASAPAEAYGGYHYVAYGDDSACNPSSAAMDQYFIGTASYWWGIYIGGENMDCATYPSASWVSHQLSEGWGLEPTWVGLQAPCVIQTGVAEMSTDTSTAFGQGEHAADSAINRATALGFSLGSMPIAYDMEAFDTTGSSSCLPAVEAFMRGWDTELTASSPHPNPGYYGSAGQSDPTDIWGISPRPNYLWGAKYDGNKGVDMTPYVSTSIFPSRLKQYDDKETISSGGYSTSVDIDCAEGPVYASNSITISDGC